jgi:C1A family cysteine protease/putative cell wall-binding protein
MKAWSTKGRACVGILLTLAMTLLLFVPAGTQRQAEAATSAAASSAPQVEASGQGGGTRVVNQRGSQPTKHSAQIRDQDGFISADSGSGLPDVAANDLSRKSPGNVKSGSLPSSYTTTKLSPVRSQDSDEDCWTYAVTSSAESSIGGVKLSTTHLANSVYNDSTFNSGGTGFDLLGGSGDMATAALTKDYGFQTESAYPDAHGASIPVLTPRQIDSQAYQLTSEVKLPNPLADGVLNQDNLSAIKQAVVDHGQLCFSYWADNGWSDLNFDPDSDDAKTEEAKYGNYLYYDSVDKPVNHSAVIIGWNDDIPAADFSYQSRLSNLLGGYKAPPDDGAFLVKNSGGADWGSTIKGTPRTSTTDGGYFWLSYDNISTCQIEEFNAGKAHGLGYSQTYDDIGYGGWAYYPTDSAYAASVYTSTKNTDLESVGYWSISKNTDVSVTVYGNLTNPLDPKSGKMIYASHYYRPYAGYYVEKISIPQSIKAGSHYSIVINYDYLGSSTDSWIPLEGTGYYGLPLDFMKCAAGQSMTSDNGRSWTDVATTADEGDPHTSESYTYGNTCMVAYTSDPDSIATTMDISKGAVITSPTASLAYTGKWMTPSMSVIYDGVPLTPPVSTTNCIVNYEDNSRPGNGIVEVTGVGQYSGSFSKTFAIIGSTTMGGAGSAYSASNVGHGVQLDLTDPISWTNDQKTQSVCGWLISTQATKPAASTLTAKGYDSKAWKPFDPSSGYLSLGDNGKYIVYYQHNLVNTTGYHPWYDLGGQVLYDDHAGPAGYTYQNQIKISIKSAYPYPAVGGTNRLSTSAFTALDAWPGGADKAVFVSGSEFYDAECANYLAGALGCPILLVSPTTSLNTTIKSAAYELGVKSAYVVGGHCTLAMMKSVGFAKYTRVASGKDGATDAVQVLQYVVGHKLQAKPSSLLLSTTSGFADALGASSYSANKALNLPILFVNGKSNATKATAEVKSLGSVKNLYVLGSSGAVATNAAKKVKSSYTRLWGSDRNQTAAAVFACFSPKVAALNPSKHITSVGIAAASNYPDALGAGTAQAHLGGVVLLTPPTSVASLLSKELRGGSYTISGSKRVCKDTSLVKTLTNFEFYGTGITLKVRQAISKYVK